jgi:hypothetical protein
MLFPAAAAATEVSIANGIDTQKMPDVPSRWSTASNPRKTLSRVEIGSFPQTARSQIGVDEVMRNSHGTTTQFLSER